MMTNGKLVCVVGTEQWGNQPITTQVGRERRKLNEQKARKASKSKKEVNKKLI